MADFKFIHAADIHLDSPLIGLTGKTDAPAGRVRGATREAFKNLVQLALDEQVSLLVIAGDLYDGPWKDMRTGIFAMEQLARLAREGIPTFIVLGNHDAESRITRDLPRRDGIHVFGSQGGEHVILEDIGAAVHGRSFATQATTENIARGYSGPVSGLFNIALLHTALEGGHRHANYAPCALAELTGSGHDYWALGHVHDHVVHASHPHVVFPGNLQGRNIRETGAKGAVLVEVRDGAVSSLRHRPLDAIRWGHLKLDLATSGGPAGLLGAFGRRVEAELAGAAGRPLILRVDLLGTGEDAHHVARSIRDLEIDMRAIAAQEGECWLEKVRLQRLAAPVELPAAIAELLEGVDEDEQCAGAVRDALEPLRGKLPANLVEEEGEAELVSALQADDMGRIMAAARAELAAAFGGSP